ncbi:hypothetical protein BaRGS_00029558, partial [Batillaria attramentaria]
ARTFFSLRAVPGTRWEPAIVTRNSQSKIGSGSFEKSCVVVPENEIEAQRISNNYKFGMKKWKSHVTSRPLATRSEIVQDLYSDIGKVKPSKIIGSDYGHFCYRMARYFIWPFGKFVHQVHEVPLHAVAHTYKGLRAKEANSTQEREPLLHTPNNTTLSASYNGYADGANVVKHKSHWTKPQTYLWLLLGIPVLWPVHAVVWFITWLFVVSIPVAKNPQKRHSEIMMYSHQAVNWYYYKMTIDGVNVILVNLLLFVVLSIVLGYADADNVVTDGVTKCILGVLAIVPLTYYVGMAITSISAQSSFAVGAILNATFGSMVEVILFIIMLEKGHASGQECYQELVKSSLTGAILVSILFIPGMSMVVGGLKFRTQNFNPKSASVSAALLFVSIAGMFSPTIFALLYGHMECEDCQPLTDFTPIQPGNGTTGNSSKPGFHCKICTQSVFGPGGDRSLYDSKVMPLVYSCAIILPIAYIVGLVFSMKTHSAEVYDEFETQLKEELTGPGSGHSHGAGSAQWSRVKSVLILLMCATAIALCGDLISENIQPLLEASNMSEYFIGVTMLSIVAELPEVVNGIQFALQNNVNLGIEIGSSTAIQVCLVQVPILVLVDLIYPMGSIVVFIYILLMMMYAFTIPPDNALCSNAPPTPGNSTIPSSTTVSPPVFGT